MNDIDLILKTKWVNQFNRECTNYSTEALRLIMWVPMWRCTQEVASKINSSIKATHGIYY